MARIESGRNTQEIKPSWESLAQAIVVEGIKKWGQLAVPPPVLIAWIKKIHGCNEEGGETVSIPARLSPDLYLATALAHGKPEAWAIWHEQIELPIIRWLTRLAGGVRLGEDLVLELGGDLFAGKFREYRGESALKTWLTVVARNRLTDRLRSEGRQGTSLDKWEGGALKASGQNLAEEVASRLDDELLIKTLEEEIKTLPEEDQKLIRQYFYGGARMRTLGKEYGISRPQIGRRLKAIYEKLCLKISEGKFVTELHDTARALDELLGHY